jgi:hypothetical protein
MDNAYRVITHLHRLDDGESHTQPIYTLDGALTDAVIALRLHSAETRHMPL